MKSGLPLWKFPEFALTFYYLILKVRLAYTKDNIFGVTFQKNFYEKGGIVL